MVTPPSGSRSDLAGVRFLDAVGGRPVAPSGLLRQRPPRSQVDQERESEQSSADCPTARRGRRVAGLAHIPARLLNRPVGLALEAAGPRLPVTVVPRTDVCIMAQTSARAGGVHGHRNRRRAPEIPRLAERRRTCHRSVAFYRALLGVEPAKVRADYAKFDLAEPPLVLSLIPGKPAAGGNLNHVGLRVRTAEELVEIQRRLEMAGMPTEREDGVECCYARQTQVLDQRSRSRAVGDLRLPRGHRGARQRRAAQGGRRARRGRGDRRLGRPELRRRPGRTG